MNVDNMIIISPFLLQPTEYKHDPIKQSNTYLAQIIYSFE